MNELDIKYFTPSEAAKTLPLVKNITSDIMECGTKIRDLADILGEDARDHESVRKLVKEIDGFISELKEIGCYYKDWNFTVGLVDFPSIIEGDDVFLCWRTDEESIMYYHKINEGYAGRKLIPPEYMD